jgi:thiol:disulfide interchange protein DsbD
MALTFTLVSFTCTVGFVGIVLAQAAKGHWFFPAIGMLAFSLSFSIPFFFLALFPSWANRLRGKSGDWMVAIKVVLGFLELAGSFKFLSNVDLLWHWGLITRPLVLTLWAASFLLATLYLLRLFTLPSSGGPDGAPRSVGPIRMMFALLMLALAIHAGGGIRGTRSLGGWFDGWLPPAVYPGDEQTAAGDDLPWMKDDLEAAYTEGRRQGRPVMIDFTGYTCTNCRYMEGSMFPRTEIRGELAKMIRVQAFTDCDAPVCDQQRAYQVKRFDTAALPFYAIINPHNDATLATFASSTNDAAEYARFLQDGLRAFEAAQTAQKAQTAQATPQPPAVVLDEGGPPVDFSFPLLAGGGGWKLSSLRGQWIVINFWASWCGPCVAELEHDFPPAMRKAPWVKLVTITFEEPETKAEALAFAKKQGLLKASVALFGGPTVKKAKLDAAFDSNNGLPASYLIAPDGHIAWKHHGSIDGPLLDQVLGRTAAPLPPAR